MNFSLIGRSILHAKKSYIFIFFLLGFSVNAFSQGINFQGVARSANGTIIASSNISLRLSIIAKAADTTPEYVETKTVTTNSQGIFSIVVGDASNTTVTGSFKSISWANAPKFLKVEMDPAGGANYINMGTTQLQYVPYSFYSLGVAAGNVNGILPVEKGGTGVGSLDSLKAALKIPIVDTISLNSKIASKLTGTDTVSLSNRINIVESKINNQASLFTTLNISQFNRDKLTNLKPGSVIWCTNCASNGELQVYNGNGWRNVMGGNVSLPKPELDSTRVSSITGHSVNVSSYIIHNEGTNLNGGFCWGTTPSPTYCLINQYFDNNLLATKKDSFQLSSSISNLSKNTRYYVRSYAANNIGSAYGPDAIFTTNTITSRPVNPSHGLSYISYNKIAFNLSIEDKGGEDITESGIEYATNINYTNAIRVNTKNSSDEYVMNNLIPSQKYYVRGYAKNVNGETIQSDTANFTALDMTQEQAKTTVQIGTQIWTARNLNVFNYRNGDPIPLVTDSATWSNLTTGAYTYYKNDSITYGYLGKIYNWYAFNDSRGIAPTGWHIPTLTEVDNLISYLGGSQVAGPKLTNTKGWYVYDNNVYPTNSTGFSALMAGGRQIYSPELPDFSGNNWGTSFFWCKDNYSFSNASAHNYRALFNINSNGISSMYDIAMPNYTFAKAGMYVRLIKD